MHICDHCKREEASESKQIEYGIPQGSLLGPRLCGIHANDLPDSSVYASIETSADDSTAYCIGNSVDGVTPVLQEVINYMNAWSKSNSLTIHPGKTELMVITRSGFIGPLPNVTMDGHTIDFVSKSTCLGMEVDNRLKWSAHIKTTCKKFSQKLKQLKRMNSLSPEVLEAIYFKGILPSVAKGISVWGNCSTRIFQNLEHTRVRVARIIHKIPETVPDHWVLDNINWKNIFCLYKRRVACITYEAYHELSPEPINKLIQKSTNMKLFVNRPKSEIGRTSFMHRCALIWNSLPKNLKNKPSLQSFEKELGRQSHVINGMTFNSTALVRNKDIDNFVY